MLSERSGSSKILFTKAHSGPESAGEQWFTNPWSIGIAISAQELHNRCPELWSFLLIFQAWPHSFLFILFS
jgi:hypothetical protein